jgi:molybdate transport system substrate-binding protein
MNKLVRILGWVFLVAAMAVPARAADLVVFAAASLQESLSEAADSYAATGTAKPVISFAASSTLARQIENGADASFFVSADEQWMDYLAQKKLIVPETRIDYLGNTLVLIAPAARPFKTKIAPGFPLATIFKSGMLAMGDPDAVPAGKYGKAALEKLGVWDGVKDHVAAMDSVRSALALVERDEVTGGIVYGTDAAVSKKVVVVDTFPEDSHPPIVYPLALIKGHDTKGAKAFRAYLLSSAGKAVFAKYGFTTK